MPLIKNFLSQKIRSSFVTTGADQVNMISYSRWILGDDSPSPYNDKWVELAAGSASSRTLTLSVKYMSVRGVYIPLSKISGATSVTVAFNGISNLDLGRGAAPQNYFNFINTLISNHGQKSVFIGGDSDAPNKAYHCYANPLDLGDEFMLIFEETLGGTGWTMYNNFFFGFSVRGGVVQDSIPSNSPNLSDTLRLFSEGNGRYWSKE